MPNRYFHIQFNILIQNKWNKGDIVHSGVNPNRFYGSIVDSIGRKKKEQRLFEYTRKVIDDNALPPSILFDPNPTALIQRVAELEDVSRDLYFALRQTNKLIRETIFEEVRNKNYSHRPSRLTGIWLCSYEHLKNWFDGFEQNRRIYEVEVIEENGSFETNADLILSDDRTVNELYELANQYWEGLNDSAKIETKEILFNGKLKVINEYYSLDEI